MDWYIVDMSDCFILFQGTLEECNAAIDTMYGGLWVMHRNDLPANLTNRNEFS